MIKFPPLYPVMPDQYHVDMMLRAGAKFIQLRLKDKSLADVRSQIKSCLAMAARYQAIIVVNDYWQLAIEYGASYIHLGQEDLQTADLSVIRAAGIQYGISTHSHEELAIALQAKPDYIALGPIYPTLLKKMPWQPQGLQRVQEWKLLIGKLPLVAIGGITQQRAADVLAAGADSVAVVTDIVQSADPTEHARQWIQDYA